MSDTELLKAILEGGIAEDKALDFIYNATEYRDGAKKVYRTFSNIKLKTWLDIFHDTIIQLIKSIRLGKYKQENKILVYFLGIYRHKCREALRQTTGIRATIEIPPEDLTDLQSPIDFILNDGLKDLLRQTMQRLDDKCRNLLTLWSEKYSMKEITQQMKLTNERMAITYNARCKKKLIKLIAEDTQIEKALNEYRWT